MFVRAFSSAAELAIGLKHITVLGGGAMGAGIAQVSLQSGYSVCLVDQSTNIINQSRAKIEKGLQKIATKKFPEDKDGAEKFFTASCSRLASTTDMKKGLESADLLVEAITENLDVKLKVFAELDAVAPPKAIFASNTSSFSISKMAEATRRADRFGGLHFFNPVPIMKLVEVVRTNETSDTTNSALLKFGESLGKVPIQCKDTPGFIVNRLLVPFLAEAVRMAERGDASLKDIDTAMKLGANHPIGPLALADYVGLDVTKFILDGWHKEMPDNALFNPSPMLNDLVAQGKLGIKTGQGFFSYGGGK